MIPNALIGASVSDLSNIDGIDHLFGCRHAVEFPHGFGHVDGGMQQVGG